ncbi:unnamed protein product [Clavelina lepadiformis]|uniref:Ileal sodium/bile acid cotransporter n=1 Tax=Clavelina lepadiformis TaxID=159417 RepID=A0ABP0G415_CLALP
MFGSDNLRVWISNNESVKSVTATEATNTTAYIDMEKFCAQYANTTEIIHLPSCHQQTRSQYSKILSITLVTCISIVMFAMGCKVQVKKVRQRIIRPWSILIGFFCQFGIMPLCAFAVGSLANLSRAKALAVLIMGCLPGGNASNLITYWSNGDLDLSIAMTAMSTIFAFAMMPFCLFVYGRFFLIESVAIPYANICILLAAFIAPVAVGMAFNYCKPDLAESLAKVGAVVGIFVVVAAATVGIILYPSAFHIPKIYWVIGFILPLLGYLLGYLAATLVSLVFKGSKIDENQRRTIAIETGTQNSQLCTTITQLNYGCTCLILEMYSYPLVYFVYEIFEACLFCAAFQIYDHFFKQSGENEATVNNDVLRNPTFDQQISDQELERNGELERIDSKKNHSKPSRIT